MHLGVFLIKVPMTRFPGGHPLTQQHRLETKLSVNHSLPPIFLASTVSLFYLSSFSRFGIVGQNGSNLKNAVFCYFSCFSTCLLHPFFKSTHWLSLSVTAAPSPLSTALLLTQPTSPSMPCGLHLCSWNHCSLLFFCKDPADFLYCFLSVTPYLSISSPLLSDFSLSTFLMSLFTPIHDRVWPNYLLNFREGRGEKSHQVFYINPGGNAIYSQHALGYRCN